MTNKNSKKVFFSKERKYLNLIISFLEHLLNSGNNVFRTKEGKEVSLNISRTKNGGKISLNISRTEKGKKYL